jgi:hypothetical protein
MCKTYPETYIIANGEMKTFFTNKIGKWSMYPYASCGTSNHDMRKCQRR